MNKMQIKVEADSPDGNIASKSVKSKARLASAAFFIAGLSLLLATISI